MRAAFYEKDITPPLYCHLAGSYTNYVAKDVLDPLHVKTALFENDGVYAAAVAIDTCEMPDDMHDIVTKRISEHTPIPPEAVLLSATHDHKGIPITDEPQVNAYADEAFKDVVYRLIADSVILAYMRLKPAKTFFGKSKCEGISFCRDFIDDEGNCRTFKCADGFRPAATPDREVPVIFVTDENDAPMGAVVSFACHQDTVHGDNYSGQYSSVAAGILSERFGRDFVTVFFQGTAGDVNHVDAEHHVKPPRDFYKTMGEKFAASIEEAIMSSEPMPEDVGCAKSRLPVKRRILEGDALIEESQKLVEEKDLMSLSNLMFYNCSPKSEETEVWVQCLKIGDAVLMGFPGEIFTEFGLDAKARSPFGRVLNATLCNTGCGYVAPKYAHTQKSRLYETKLCFGACLDENAGYQITDELIRLAKTLSPKQD
ncbi:MAG: hypothetical protein IJV00_04975 [Clostridia bacterium]|nr:hypothetical protein [Clostridia bacterium]